MSQFDAGDASNSLYDSRNDILNMEKTNKYETVPGYLYEGTDYMDLSKGFALDVYGLPDSSSWTTACCRPARVLF